MKNIGFIQGRISPMVDGKIQAFPWESWEKEFELANLIGFQIMEWTLDYENLYKNPLMTSNGQNRINGLMKKFDLNIPSLTGDCFMQKPFFKYDYQRRDELILDLKNIIQACRNISVKHIVFPLVDNGSIKNSKEEKLLIEGLQSVEETLLRASIKIIFESDFNPKKLKTFISKFPKTCFGINYDSGNSAALGYDPDDEFQCYGERILNVHIKDRIFKGTTVPLGEGNVNFPKVIWNLKNHSYTGNYILQTARSKTDHAGALSKYREKLINWLNN